jgi:hypothetical protein
MPRWFTRNDNWDFGGKPDPADEPGEPKSRKRRLATAFIFTVVFFAGASLAAVAGNRMSAQVSDDSALDATTTTTTTTTDAASDPVAAAGQASTDAASDPAEAAAPADAAPSTESSAPDAAVADTPDSDSGTADSGFTQVSKASSSGAAAASSSSAKAPRAKRGHRVAKRNDAQSQWQQLRSVLLPKTKPAPKPEIEGPPEAATVWLNRPLPDPTPPALRLSARFAQNLKSASQQSGVSWPVLLGILRARGATGHMPADRVTLNRLAGRLGSFGPVRGDWARIVAYSGDSRFADKVAALANYDRAVGLNALVKGLEATKAALATRILSDPNVSIYAGGRNDIVNNKIDVRVLATIAYLRETFGSVTVSCLLTGHRLYARPGVISAHIYGRAVDISAVGGVSIQGHQQPGGITEHAVREILLLPQEVMPRQVISLLGLGGPSFPLADHYNHIHIGY